VCPGLLLPGYINHHIPICYFIADAVHQALNEFSGHEVHLYEAAARPGGHAHTASFVQSNKDVHGEQQVHVDM
jgi:hypothetical protein